MAFEINLPRLGWDMEEGILAAWLKEDGEFVEEGEFLFSVEGDKAVQEIEALDSGILRILPDGPQPGEKVPVGTILGYLVPKKELDEFEFPGDETEAQPVSEQEKPKESQPRLSKTSPSESITGNQRDKRVYISPYAKKLAEDKGVEWRSLQGSGRGGRIMAKDVKEAISALEKEPKDRDQKYPPVPVGKLTTPAHGVEPHTVVPMTQIRRKISEHMAVSAHTTAPVTLTAEVDATELVALRKQLREDVAGKRQSPPSYNDMLAKISAKALLEHPWMNARIQDDEIIQMNSVHVAIAVDTDRGLLVPVVRDAQTKSLREIADESARLIEKTRQGTVGLNDLQGGTFTITNLGMFEINAFTPIIDLPQCAILGVGQIVPKQVVIRVEPVEVAIQHRMVLSLTFDHRLVDGAQAARFLQRMKRLIEKPYLWLSG